MEITKLKERDFGSFVTKNYYVDENVKAPDLTQMLIDNGSMIYRVFVKEDVELDAKTVEGNYNVDDFKQQYDRFLEEGSNLLFEIYGNLNEVDYTLSKGPDSGLIFLSSVERNLELDDLIKKNEKMM